jgi:hypothetical protein
MPVASKIQVKTHSRRIGRKIYKVQGYIRKKRPQSTRVKQYTPVGTLEIGHDKYGNIVGNRVIKKQAGKSVKRMRLSPDQNLKLAMEEYIKEKVEQKKI